MSLFVASAVFALCSCMGGQNGNVLGSILGAATNANTISNIIFDVIGYNKLSPAVLVGH